MTTPFALGLLAAGLVLGAVGWTALVRRHRDDRHGRLVAIDAGRPRVLRSERFHLVGRPDVLRLSETGALTPIELKHRPVPRRGAFPSHIVQVWAYCLLVEEETGRSPPFGVLRYSDGEVRVPWNPTARSKLLALRVELLRTYDGRATPSPGRCRGCAWNPICDARAVVG